ncbi:hypothetical protein E2C01_027677 [Portunus trituberculatus]|uniref:Uncharacterized protein n=1 Tax=Portunus trituberculatus TaxID=210409 RepID=A0A5B7EMM4_PORTR|nr:hypothetical protein [Portunus trituberculatus]
MCSMNHEQLDFQVLDTREVVPALEALLHYRFPTTEGPLWCARLLHSGDLGHCSRHDLATTFPHSRTLLLANHHGIADGTTNMFVTDSFLRILDDVLAGKPVDDTVQFGKVVAGEETKALLAAKMEELTKDKDSFKQLQNDLKNAAQAEKLIPQAYPMPRDPNYKCQIVLRDLDKESTMCFIKKCKQEGVTVNSGLASVFNVSLVDFVREGGLQQDFYRIRELHTVSLRRNWSGDTSGTLGVHMMPFENKISTPARWQNNFWEYARDMHKSLTQAIQRNNAFLYVLLSSDEGSMDDHFKERPMPECDYGSANMGNVDRLIPTEGQHVRLAHLLRVTSCWNDPMYYMFHTLRGCFMYSLTYASDVLSRENAQRLVDKTFDNLKAVTQIECLEHRARCENAHSNQSARLGGTACPAKHRI